MAKDPVNVDTLHSGHKMARRLLCVAVESTDAQRRRRNSTTYSIDRIGGINHRQAIGSPSADICVKLKCSEALSSRRFVHARYVLGVAGRCWVLRNKQIRKVLVTWNNAESVGRTSRNITGI